MAILAFVVLSATSLLFGGMCIWKWVGTPLKYYPGWGHGALEGILSIPLVIATIVVGLSTGQGVDLSVGLPILVLMWTAIAAAAWREGKQSRV